MSEQTVMIIEDDPAMLRGLVDNFTHLGYRVVSASDGQSGLDKTLQIRPDLLILDIMLPRISGYELCRLVRQQGLEMPIIMLTAKDQECDVVLGLDLGADDYVAKPFSVRELSARVKAMLRRRQEEQPGQVAFGPWRLDLASHRLTGADGEVPLTPREFRLLAMLASRPGRAWTRGEILRSVWGCNVFVTERSVDRYINALRKKIEPDPTHPVYIHTVREAGYRFDARTAGDGSDPAGTP
jgi:DNA-binding response OmpR family regulator